MKPLIILALMLILAGCQPAVRSPYDMQQKFFSGVKNSSVSADQALRSAHYFKIAGRRDLALRELSAAVALEPNNTRLLNALGACYDEMGDYTTAQQIFQESLSLDPANAAALNNLGYSYYLAGNLEQAEAALQTSLAKDPNNKRARNNLGMVFCRLGKNDRALSLWQQQDGQAQAQDKLVKVMASLGKPLPADLAKPISAGEIVLARSHSTPAKNNPAPVGTERTSEPAGPSQPTTAEQALAKTPVAPALPSVEKTSGSYARIMLPPETMAKKPPQEIRSEPAAPAVMASQSEEPSTHSRTKIISVVAQKDQRLPGKEGEQAISGGIENYQLLTQSQGQGKPAPPETAVKSLIPDTDEVEAGNLEIRNGVGVKHLAHNMRRLLNHHGYKVAIARNHIDFGAPETVVYFRSGQEKAAKQINDRFLKATRLEKKENLRPGIDIKVVLGHDLFQNNQYLAPFQASVPKLQFGPELALNLHKP